MSPTRKYHSPRRTEQARATRRAILQAAERLFYDHGYPSTSIRQIAATAEVSEETIYSVFGDKPSLLKAVGSRLLGTDDETPLADTELGRSLAREEDLAGRVRIAVRYTLELAEQGDFRGVVEAAVAADSRLAELSDWADEQSHQDTMALLELVVGDALDERARAVLGDIVWSMLSTQTLRRLIQRRGWSVDVAEPWLTGFIDWAIAEAKDGPDSQPAQ